MKEEVTAPAANDGSGDGGGSIADSGGQMWHAAGIRTSQVNTK